MGDEISIENTVNIFILGKSGAGKTTILNQLLGKEKFKVALLAGSVTQHVQYGKVKLTRDNEVYHCTIIDGRGFDDTNLVGNLEIIEQFKTAMTRYTASPNTVNLLLVVSKDIHDTYAFSLIKKNFTEKLSKVSVLILTHCDLYSEEERKKFIDSFEKHTDLYKFMGKGMYTVGFPTLKDQGEE